MSHYKDDPPVLYITYALDEPDTSVVLDVSYTLAAARRAARTSAWSGYCYRSERRPDGSFSRPEFVAVIPGAELK